MSGGRALPQPLRHALEALSGHDMSDVRVHFDSRLPAAVGARALASGLHVHLQPGAEDALAHEAWHVVQQKQGRVTPTRLVDGVAVNDDPRLEAEAERLGGAAERFFALRAVERCPRVGLRKSPIVRPVVQRSIVVGDNTPPQDARATRTQLSLLGVDAGNTPHLQAIINDVVGDTSTFREYPDWSTVRLEVKHRSFGLRHVDAMDTLLIRQDTARDNYMRTHGYDTQALESILTRYAAQLRNNFATLNNTYGAPTFIYWTNFSSPSGAQESSVTQNSSFYRWYTNQNNSPLRMNCWECVLYSGAWTGAGPALYGRDYALWALMSRVDGSKLPFFVDDIIEHPALVLTNQKQRNEDFFEIPRNIAPGMIVVFNFSQHVALATGRMVANTIQEARSVYGDRGHEILEIDRKTYWMQSGTIEDAIASGYRDRIHFGWLPEVPPNVQPIVLRSRKTGEVLFQTNVQPTAFYA